MTSSNHIFIILLSIGIGGAEKRFTENWINLNEQGIPAWLVISEVTYNKLLEQFGEEVLLKHSCHILRFECNSNKYIPMLFSVYNIVRSIPKESIVHYPMSHFPFIHSILKHKLIVSWVDSSLPPLFKFNLKNFKKWVVPRMAFLEAKKIDVLNPKNHKYLSNSILYKRKISLTTGGTFVDFNKYQFNPDKENQIVFLGRLEAEKNAYKYVTLIPEIDKLLKEKNINVTYRIFGGGTEEEQIRKHILHPSYSHIPLEVKFTSKPEEALYTAKVFLSLQRSSNYPSKALAEAMACGAIPVMTDVGESRMMAHSEIAEFIPKEFNAKNLANAINNILSLPEKRIKKLSLDVHRFSKNNFIIDVQIAYFISLYTAKK